MNGPPNEEDLRTALAAEAGRLPLPLAPVDALVRGGRARRVRRATVAGSAVAVLAAVPVAAVVLAGGNDVASTREPATGASAGRGTQAVATVPPVAASPRRVVAPGERIRLAPNVTMSLDTSGKCLYERTPGSATELDRCKSAVDGNQGENTVSLQSQSEVGERSVYSGLYIGSGTPAWITLTGDGFRRTATIVTLTGKPRWVAYYALGPRLDSIPEPTSASGRPLAGPSETVTVYDRRGHVLAKLETR